MRSLKYKLLLLILPLCLIPLIGFSLFAYFVAKQRITEDRIVLYLEQIAQDIADTLQLTLLEKQEETVSMSLHSEFRDYVLQRTDVPPQELLDKLIVVHEVYDLLVLFDVEGRVLLTNSRNRRRVEERLDPEQLKLIRGNDLSRYTTDVGWLQRVRSGRLAFVDWHVSPLVHQLYRYLEEDIARQYSIGFAVPVLDERGIVVGGILALMNWEYIQEILDKVEEDLEQRSLTSGYAFLFGSDQNTVIGHKYRRNRSYHQIDLQDVSVARDNYRTRLIEDHQLPGLQQAVVEGKLFYEYEYPKGTYKISGLAAVNHELFQWVCGVGINNEDIFAPVQDLKKYMVGAVSLSILLVVGLTYSLARGITIPLKKLRASAGVIAAGDFTQRVEVSGRDEIGELAGTFNEMAQSLEERSQAVLELNRRLEEKVRERTQQLERKNEELEKAYDGLKEAQVQLIQSEKMASLGQLVAGIAHEIKNPLNFIYGNTDFLKKYTDNLKQLISLYESKLKLDPKARDEIASLKQEMNYAFMLEDLEVLVRNFEEGARRINAIIADLKTFSRMDSDDQYQLVDIHEPLELALNLLQNQYRGRIRIHKEYGQVPRVECHAGKLSQVFMNLLSNACQAISSEGDIWVRTSSQNGAAVIEVEDNGVGIERDHLGKVFEPFFTTKTVGKGTGLGLSISYGIIKQHGGRIEVESEKGRGTKFRVQLPMTVQRRSKLTTEQAGG